MRAFHVVYASVVCAAGTLFVSAPAAGHHSRAEFGTEVIEIEGTITETLWVNPHPYVVLKVTDEGNAADWRVEMWGNLFTTERLGLSAERFAVGATLRVAGTRSTRRDDYFLAHNVLLADGTEAVLAAQTSPRWMSAAARSTDVQRSEYESYRARAALENRGIFRVWTPDPSVRQAGRGLPYTASAIAARAEWDELDSFLSRCEQPGMPRTVMTPQEAEFVDRGGTIELRAQFFDTVRTIHLDDAREPAEQPSSHLGYSVGRWDGRSLVVETSRIDWPYFDTNGTPQSESVHVFERYTLSEDQSRLDVEFTITDLVTFTEPAHWTTEWWALGRTIEQFDCQVLRVDER